MDPASATVTSEAPLGARLAPDERRRHLLAVARTLVEDQGIGALSLERVATKAGVSRALIYTYFDNRSGLIRALWDEVATLWNVAPMPPYEELLGSSTPRELFDRRLEENTRWYLDEIEQSGLLLHRLLLEPVVESSVELARKRIESSNIAWWARLVQAMGVDEGRAHVFSALLNSSSQAMWSLFARGEQPRHVIEDLFFLTCRSALEALLVDCGVDSSD